MTDLRNTIAHILEHKQHLAEVNNGANEATTQQYVVLPILRALGWDDTNLASMEVLPEYLVKGRKHEWVDYALKVGQKPTLFIECKKWDEPLDEHEDQIVTYALKERVRIAGLTNGKIWRFYLLWIDGSLVSDSIFCETDIEDREAAISDLEKYLLKSNVRSGEAELNAEIALEEKTNSKPNPIDQIDDAGNEINNEPIKSETAVTGERTIKTDKDLLSSPEHQKIKAYLEEHRSEEERNVFCRTMEEIQNLIKIEDWRLEPKFNEKSLSFRLGVKGVFGIELTAFKLYARIMEKDAEELKCQYSRCEFCSVHRDKSTPYMDYIYHDIPNDITELRPVLEFAYKKHTSN